MKNKLLKILSILLCFSLIFEQSGFAQIAGQLDISSHLAGLHNAFVPDIFRPLHLRYLSYNPLENNFQLFLDKGSLKNPNPQELQDTTKTLLNYFFIGVALPNDTFWVNLRPDAEDNIIDEQLAKTDIGKIMLETDLQLKKDTARFTSPETPEGKEYWDKLYQKAGEIFGSENISIPTLTRPWIVPDEIIIRETLESAYIYKATLKVMLEQDYLKDSAVYNFEDERLKELNEYSSQLIREIIIPKLTKEVNSSKRYASLRQVYYSLIMAQWFKVRYYGKGGLYSHLINRKDLTNLTSKESWSKTTYFKEYQKSFKNGEYNIKEPVYTPFGQTIRSYFSGGTFILIPMPLNMGEEAKDPKTDGSTIRLAGGSSPVVRANEITMTFQGPEPGLAGIQVASSPMVPQDGVGSATEVDNISTGILEALIRPYEEDNKIYVDGIDRNQTPLTSFVKAMQGNRVNRDEISSLFTSLQSLDPQLRQRVGEWLSDIRRAWKEGKYNIWDVDTPLPVPEDMQQQVLELHRRLQTESQNSHLQDLAIELIRIKTFREDRKKLAYKMQEYLRKSGNLDEDINLRIGFNDVVEKAGQLMGLTDEQIKSIQQSVLLIKSYNRKLSAEEEAFLNLIRILSHINEKGTVESKRDVMLIMKYQKDGIIKTEFKDSFDSSDFSPNSDLTYSLPEGGKEILWRELKRLAPPDIFKLALIIAHEFFTTSADRFRDDRFAENKNIILINSTDTERELKQAIAAEAGHAILDDLSRYKIEELDLAVHEAFDALLDEIIIPGSSEELRWPLRVAIAKVIKRAIKDGEFTKNGLLKEERDSGLDYYFGFRKGMKKSDHDEIGNIVIELMRNPIALRRILAKLGLSEEEAYIVSDSDPALVSHAIGIFLTSNFIRSFGTLVTARVFKKIATEQPRALSDFRLFEETFYNLQPQVSREFAIVPINQQGRGVYGPTSSPATANTGDSHLRGQSQLAPGGIDFRTLPIVTQAIGNLSANIRSSAINNLISINLDEEWLQIERMTSSGITPSSERIKEYIQTSCAQNSIVQDKDKILLCISDILRLQEERCDHTNPTLRDILVVLESMSNTQELKEIFLGTIS